MLKHPCFLPAFFSVCSLGFAASDTVGQPGRTRWLLNDVKSVGGLPAEIWGSPKLAPAAKTSDAAKAAGLQFNGKNDALLLPVVPIAGWSEFTIQALFAPDADGQHEQRFLHFEDDAHRRGLLEIRVTPQGSWYLDTFLFANEDQKLALIDPSKLHPCGKFYWVALTFKNGRMTHFVNGMKECEGSVQLEPMLSTGRTSIGVRQNKISWFKGVIREFRFDPQAIAQEGLERAPVASD